MYLLIILCILIIFILAWFPYYAWRDSFIPSLKGPFLLPIIGIFYVFKDPRIIFKKLMELHDTYGKSFRGYFVTNLVIATKDASLIEFATTSNKTIDKGIVYQYLQRWLRSGLLTSGGDKWRQRRKMITPAYHFKVLDQFIDVFNSNSNTMINKLRSEVDKSQTDVFPFVNLCTLDIICETAMGTKVNAQLNSNSEYVQAIKEMNRIIMERGFDFFKAMEWSYKFTTDYQIEKKALQLIHGFTMSVIKSRRDELLQTISNSKPDEIKDDEIGAKRKDNFMDLLLKSTINGQPLTNEDIQEEVDTFMFEGHDTVTSAISFTLYLLSNHPEIQDKVVNEQREIFGDNPHREVTMTDLQEMKYLELVMKESLRLYPSVPAMVREVTEDVTYGDWFLRKGTQIGIFIYALHRDPKVFPNPEEFRPERFELNNVIGRHPYAYIPFSAGHRNCIGQKFAQLEMKSTISKVIRNFELLPLVPKHEPYILSEIVLRSENGVLMKLKDRVW